MISQVSRYSLSLLLVLSTFGVSHAGEGGGNNLSTMTAEEYRAWRAEQQRLIQEARQREAERTANNYEGQAKGAVGTDALNGGGKLETPSANQAARSGQGSNNAAGQIAQMVGQALQSQGTSMMASCCGRPGGSSCCAKGSMLLGMGILGLLQAAANRSTAGQHGYVADITYDGAINPYDNQYNNGGATGADGSTSPFAPNVQDKIKELEGKGFEFSVKDGRLVTPGGKSFNVKDVTNKDAMAAIGVTPGDFNDAMSIAAGLEKKAMSEVEKIGAHTPVQGLAEGGGGGAGSGGMGREISSTSDGSSDSYTIRKKADDPKPTVAGMMKNYNGEMIGVAGDSIFAMMSRRYQQKSKEEAFLPPESIPTN